MCLCLRLCFVCWVPAPDVAAVGDVAIVVIHVVAGARKTTEL